MLNKKTASAKYVFYKWFTNHIDDHFVKLELENIKKVNKWDMKTLKVLDSTAEKGLTLTQKTGVQPHYNLLFWFYSLERPQKGNVYNAISRYKHTFTPEYVKNSEGSLALLDTVLVSLNLESVASEQNNLKHLLSALSLSDLLLK
jgi:hypothetical protein